MPFSTPTRLRSRTHGGFDLHDVSGVDRAAIPDALDAPEERQLLAILRLRENQDRADLRDGFRENRRRKHRRIAVPVREVALVERHVLDADDALVGNELGDAIDQQKRVPVRKDPLDRRVVERQRNVHVRVNLQV